ncbi:D-alanyl-D-alanine carboxypeptidase (penicillin-binding protein 5/6) [Saccharopolyspora kobensis]|uniref:D-alanyl-D-alanine carboxypeptidase (Penicillin-binding protein 5/6) n=1 Tax=Saccharopolyspora kobensis TaxID=146035 RepID=A0A1H6EC28_9PSEU|nr:D-alanyl-D-alanine carboxypeptidase family protein [Saccharopolyspora kobensis]SEG94823.1 D-alanyl-D-alanine carboxypeptidase (penicillin-binding protein 5/6) [Saccharopolyspora kobensis]SFD62506.1 D-alanyl-D-alanine carboxypeptidase (penicillin-binding protein 5/6) [Saccharopolyspora kobensis]
MALPLLSGTAHAEDCYIAVPPPPVDTSEVPLPGQPVPEPVPVPETPVGGEQLGGCGPAFPVYAPAPPAEISAASWLVADLDTGAVLAAHEPHARHRPASTIKVLTALVALRDLQLDDTLVATQEDANQEGSRVGLAPGATYTVREVLTGLILRSGNDAAHALAMKLGGVEATVDKMNALAKSLGALDTRAATPSGLDGPGMSTSAYDLAVIFRVAMQNPAFAEIVSTHQAFLPGAPGGPPLEVWSDNQVLRAYPGGLGGKTGFTDDARHTYIGAADRGGRRLVAVLMRGENQPVRLSAQTMRLLDYGFELNGAPVGELVTASPAPIADVQPVDQSVQAQSEDPMFGTVGGPLALLAAAAAAVVAAIAVQRRRAALARRRRSGGDDHP